MQVIGVRDSIAFLRDPAGFAAGAARRLAGVYRVRVPGYRLHVVIDPDVAGAILLTHQDCFHKGRIYWSELRRGFGPAMGALDGDDWKRLQSVQRPHFTPRAVDSYLPAAERIGAEALDDLAAALGDGESLDVPLMERLAALNARVVLAVLFGRDEAPEAAEVARHIGDGHRIIAWYMKYPWRPLLGRFSGVARRGRRHAAFLREYAAGLQSAAPAGERRILLDSLIRLAAEVQVGTLPEGVVGNEMIFHLGASTETQAAAEAWALILLARNPRVLTAIRDELDRVTAGERVAAPHLPELEYCGWAVREALRLYPPVHGLVRDCIRSVDLPHGTARRGDTFMISVHGLHRHPDLWDAPEEFLPERFADSRAAHGPPRYIPFGMGKRACLGRYLAIPTMTLRIAQFAQRFDWSVSGVRADPSSPSLRPSDSLMMTLRHRPAWAVVE